MDRAIREDLHRIKRIAAPTGAFRFDAGKSDEAGHADRYWALALAVGATATSGPPLALATQEPEARDWRRDREELAVVGSGSMAERRRESLMFGGGRR